MEAEIAEEIESIEEEIEKLELRRMLGGPKDANSAFVSINSGAGGTEACDWAAMLMRMYRRWAEDHSCSVT